ncbi:MAG TPA: RNA 2',3'-cyclic phosphodiesterase [Clostridia bacterium]|nr:RNA 2',3'-cyclic phosphodiesterase [Clostridia bacterium]
MSGNQSKTAEAKGQVLVLRTFVAVSLDKECSMGLSRILDELVVSGADFRWVSEDNLHITLKFLGNITADKIIEVENVLAASLEGQKGFEICLEGIGGFPKVNRPKVIWIGVKEGAARLSELARTVDKALSRIGIKREHKGFVPHVTLGRMRSPEGLGALVSKISTFEWNEPLRSRVESVLLMKSTLTPKGAKYSVLRTFPLT